VHRNKAAIAASLKTVNVIGILDMKHSKITVTVNGRKEKRCSIVPSMTCEEHFKISDYAHLEGLEVSGQVFVSVFTPEGKKPTKAVGNPGGDGYIKIVEQALAGLTGERISKADYETAIPHYDAAIDLVGKGEVRKGIELLSKVAKHKVEKFRRMGEEMLHQLDMAGEGQIEQARRLMADDPAKAREILRKVAEQYVPLACAGKAQEALKRSPNK